MKFLIATNNKKKLDELNRILAPLGVDAVTAKEVGVDLSSVEENGSTFSENAYIKAKAAFDMVEGKYCVVADDSGLCVDALDGRPGVYSARYGGENATDKDKINKLLSELDGVPTEERGANFTCSICAIMSSGDVITSQGICYGEIATSPVGDCGFGYDPIFMVKNKSFAQLSNDEKDKLSHRGKALRQFKDKLVKFMEDK
ncbi:MAG: RdgB/HAM1 family non-canonical purine NTP pyrophosphatase [Ruminococcus sp.]|nr:RdgB/HAM1 family non-canonical purine NTP pyrophosphatase [Ruminococcus sp.]